KRRAVEKRNNDHFTVGLVGYTNAGKSTIFNTLTEGGAYADDRVFATLMTRTRQWDLGGGHTAMLSDTVGFVRDLPHHLVASFRATLEEAMHADLILIVLDIADPSIELHYQTVLETLDDLFEEVETREAKIADRNRREGKDFQEYARPEYLVVLNKADKLTENADLLYWQSRVPRSIPLCSLAAKEGEPTPMGQQELIDRVKSLSIGDIRELDITVPLSDSKTIHTIENRTKVTSREYEGDSVTLRSKIGTRQLAQLRARGANMTVYTLDGELVSAPSRSRGWDEDSESPYEKKLDF
ncbi:MAG: GTPase, partial [Phycisphaerales bacterium]